MLAWTIGSVKAKSHSLDPSTPLENAVKIAAPLGTLVGQLLFGWFSDKVGRKRMCESTISMLGTSVIMTGTSVIMTGTSVIMTGTDGIELIIIIIGTFGQALATNGGYASGGFPNAGITVGSSSAGGEATSAVSLDGFNLATINIYAVLIGWRFLVSIDSYMQRCTCRYRSF